MSRNIITIFPNRYVKKLINKNFQTIQKFGTEAETEWRELRQRVLDRFMKEQQNNYQQ